VRNFDVEALGTSPSIFDPEKLRWMNGRFMRDLPAAQLGDRLVAYLTRVGFYRDPGAALPGAAGAAPPDAAPEPFEPSAVQADLTRAVAPLVQEKIEVLADFGAIAGWFFLPLELRPEALERLSATDGAAVALQAAAEGLGGLEPYAAARIEEFVRELPAALGLKPKAVFAALRLGMSGQGVTPGLFESLEALGRTEAAARLAKAAAAVS
jgi:glutamyl-tRNA synthetase